MGMDRVGTVGTGLVPTRLVGTVPTLRQGPESGSRYRFFFLFDKCVSIFFCLTNVHQKVNSRLLS